MTNINCVRDCIYQHDGKCCYDNITITSNGCQKPDSTNCMYQLFSDSPQTNEKRE